MADSATQSKPDAVGTARDLTDGFHLVLDALKLNGLTTIYHVPGIPVTDLGRLAQADGFRVISFRHEQNAGNAAAIAGFLTKKPGICLTVSAPGFLNGLVALAKGARYDKLIEAFGGVGVNATTPDELRRAVDAAMASGKPTLVNAVIDPAAGTESGRIGNLNPQSALGKKK